MDVHQGGVDVPPQVDKSNPSAATPDAACIQGDLVSSEQIREGADQLHSSYQTLEPAASFQEDPSLLAPETQAPGGSTHVAPVNPSLRGISPLDLQTLCQAGHRSENFQLSSDGERKEFSPLFEGSHLVIPDVDCSQFLDLSKSRPSIKNRTLAMRAVCSSLKNAPQLALSSHTGNLGRWYVSKRWDNGGKASESGASSAAEQSEPSEAAGAGLDPESDGVLSLGGGAGKVKKPRRTKNIGLDPDWWFASQCSAPGCPVCVVIGGFFRYGPPAPDAGKAPPKPIGVESTLHVWSSSAGFVSKALRSLQLSGKCVHANTSETGGTLNYETMPRDVAADLVERVQPGGSARAVFNSNLASMTADQVLAGNTSNVGRNRKAVNQIMYRANLKEREADGWRDDIARLDFLRKELVAKDAAELPPEPDAAKRAKRVLGFVQDISYYPRGFVVFTEPQLILYRLACRLPEGLRADYTAQVLRKVKVVEPCGDETLKHQYLFILSCPNPWSGEPHAQLHGAPPIVLMRAVSTSGTMEDLISKLLVLIAAETRRFNNNVQPTRIFTDCSLPETGAFCHVYNRMTTEAFCNLRVRQVYTNQPCKNPIDGLQMTELIWCHSHVQHAGAEYPKKKFTGQVSNALENLYSSFLVAIGHHLTHVKDFLRLVQWLKVFHAIMNTWFLPLPGSKPNALNELDVMLVGTDEKRPLMTSANASELRAKEILKWSYEGQGTLPLGTLVGVPRAGVFPNADTPSLSPQDAIKRFGAFVTITPVSSPDPKPVFEVAIPLLGIAVRVPGDPASGVLKNPLYSPALSAYHVKQWIAHLALWCQGTFCSESRFNSNVHSEIANNIEKNMDLEGLKNLSIRKLVEKLLVATKASIVRLLLLVNAVISGAPPRKKHNRQLVEGLFDSVPEPAHSDEEDQRPSSMPRKRTPAELTQLKLAHASLDTPLDPTQQHSFSLRPAQRKEIHNRCKQLAAGKEFRGDLFKPKAETIDRDGGVLRLSWQRLSDRELFSGSQRVSAGTLLAAAVGIEKAASPDRRPAESVLRAAVREMEAADVRSPEKTQRDPSAREQRKGPSPGMRRAQSLFEFNNPALPPPPATATNPGYWLLQRNQGEQAGACQQTGGAGPGVSTDQGSEAGRGPITLGSGRELYENLQRRLFGNLLAGSGGVVLGGLPQETGGRQTRGLPQQTGGRVSGGFPGQVIWEGGTQSFGGGREKQQAGAWAPLPLWAGRQTPGAGAGANEVRPLLGSVQADLSKVGEGMRLDEPGATERGVVAASTQRGRGRGSTAPQRGKGRGATSSQRGRGPNIGRGRGRGRQGNPQVGRTLAPADPVASAFHESPGLPGPLLHPLMPPPPPPNVKSAPAEPAPVVDSPFPGQLPHNLPTEGQGGVLSGSQLNGGRVADQPTQGAGVAEAVVTEAGVAKAGVAEAGVAETGVAEATDEQRDAGRPTKRQKRRPVVPSWEESEEEGEGSEKEGGESSGYDSDDECAADGAGEEAAEILPDEAVAFIDLDNEEALPEEPDEPPLEEGTTRLLDPGAESWNRPSKSGRSQSVKKLKPLFKDSWDP